MIVHVELAFIVMPPPTVIVPVPTPVTVPPTQLAFWTADTSVRLAGSVSVMAAFVAGLFAGGDLAGVPLDNLDLERWFRLPKGHERRIHGHRHAGVRLVQEGATLMPVLDAHRGRAVPYTATELLAYWINGP